MSARETSEAAARGRPLSPHMSVYKMSRYCLLSSILNRFTGLLLSAGLLLLVYWLAAVAEGEHAYGAALAVLSSVPLEVVYALLLAAFSYHLVAGVRHLIWDTGRGLSRVQSQRSAFWVFAVSIVIAIVLIGWAFLPAAGAR
jgi:succinate dehydrogenase cytochrome b subunit